MNKTTCASLGLVLLLAYGCGPRNTFSPPSLPALISPVEAPAEVNKSNCVPVDTFSTSEADKTVVNLSKDLVISVLNDLGNKSYNVKTFWTDISQDSREKLNFAINVSLKKSRPANEKTIYRATAFFMTNRLGRFLEGYDYRIKDISGQVISFVDGTVQNPIMMDLSSICVSNVGLDLSYIKVPELVIMPSEVTNLISCRFTEDRHFMLMQARSSFMVVSDKKFVQALKSEGRLSDSRTKIKVKLDTPELKLEMNMKKKSEMTINGIIGSKTTVDLSMPDLYIKEIGACHEL